MLKAVIFDMDDTLVDWSARKQDWRRYEREHLRRVFDYVVRDVYPLRDFEAFFQTAQNCFIDAWADADRHLHAPHLGRALVETLLALGIPPERLDADACLRAYDWGVMPDVTLYPDVPDTLALLRKAGLRLGLVTNAFAPMRLRDRELAQLGLPPETFDCRLSSADAGYLKPHPAIFEAALDCLGVRSDEAVFVGDSLETDIAGAQSVGMRGVLRTGPEAPAPSDGLSTSPDAVIVTLADLPAVLDAWYPGWGGSTR